MARPALRTCVIALYLPCSTKGAVHPNVTGPRAGRGLPQQGHLAVALGPRGKLEQLSAKPGQKCPDEDDNHRAD